MSTLEDLFSYLRHSRCNSDSSVFTSPFICRSVCVTRDILDNTTGLSTGKYFVRVKCLEEGEGKYKGVNSKY